MNELVSIIIPTYNDQSTIEKSIESVLNQTYKEIEVIIVNDGSTDKTTDILYLLSDKDSRLNILNQSNMGVAIARNRGLSISQGKYILFVDADDWIEQNYVETLMINMEKSGADLVLCGWNIYKQRKQELKFYSSSEIESFISGDLRSLRQYYIKLFYKGYMHGPIGKLYKNSIIKQHGIKFPNYRRSEDIFFNNEYFQYVEKVYANNEKIYNIRIIDSFIKIKNKSDNNHLQALNNHFDTIKDINNSFNKILTNWDIDEKSYGLVNSTYMKMIINNLNHLMKIDTVEARSRINDIINDDFTQYVADKSTFQSIYLTYSKRLIIRKKTKKMILLYKIKNVIKIVLGGVFKK